MVEAARLYNLVRVDLWDLEDLGDLGDVISSSSCFSSFVIITTTECFQGNFYTAPIMCKHILNAQVKREKEKACIIDIIDIIDIYMYNDTYFPPYSPLFPLIINHMPTVPPYPTLKVSVRAPCCKRWFDCPQCHAESATDHKLLKIHELVMACKQCKKVFRKDSRYVERECVCM